MVSALWVTLFVTMVVAMTNVCATRATARLRVEAGGNATCSWKVALLDADDDDGGHEICTEELGIVFVGSPSTAGLPTIKSHRHSTKGTTTLPPSWLSKWAPFPGGTKDTVTLERGDMVTTTTVRPAALRKLSITAPPKDYELLPTGSFYKLHLNRRLRWHDARKVCESEGSHLLVIETNEEAAAIRDYLYSKYIATERTQTFTLHAGFRLNLVTNDGDSLLYEQWDYYEPSSRFCGQIDNDAWLRYGICSNWLPFICEYQPTQSTVVKTAPLAEIDSSDSSQGNWSSNSVPRYLAVKGYLPLPGLNNTYIKNYGVVGSWNEAKTTCDADGAYLPVIKSEKWYNALLDYMGYLELKMFVGFKTENPVTVLGEPLSMVDYNRWTEKSVDETCFYANRKLLHASVDCQRSEWDDYETKIYTICVANAN